MHAIGGTFFTQLLSNTNHAEFMITFTGLTDARLVCAFPLFKGVGVRDLGSGECDGDEQVEGNIVGLR